MQSFADNLRVLSVQFPPFVIAVVFHEFAHGAVASRFGDPTAKEAGRLTLNPFPHLDPVGTVLFPVLNMLMGINILFGWAKPVPINPARFKKLRPGLFWVSFAGPGMNFLLAVVSAALFCAIELWMPKDFYLFEPLLAMSYVSVSLNYALGIFNLIPLPPLDGSKIVQAFLSISAARKYESFARYSFFILLALMFTGAFTILARPIQYFANTTLGLMAYLFHLPEVS